MCSLKPKKGVFILSWTQNVSQVVFIFGVYIYCRYSFIEEKICCCFNCIFVKYTLKYPLNDHLIIHAILMWLSFHITVSLSGSLQLNHENKRITCSYDFLIALLGLFSVFDIRASFLLLGLLKRATCGV